MTQTEAQRKIDTIAKRFKQNKEDQVKFVFASSILILADTEFFKEWINRTADARILEKAYKEKGLFTGEQRRFLFRDCLKSAYAGGAFELYELYLAFADDLEPLKEIVAAYTEPTRRSKTFSPGLNELALRILGRASSDAGDFVEYCCGDATALSDAYMRGLAQHYYGQDRDDFKTDIIAALKRKALHAEDAMTITNGDVLTEPACLGAHDLIFASFPLGSLRHQSDGLPAGTHYTGILDATDAEKKGLGTEWKFVHILLNSLSEKGKAVAIMSASLLASEEDAPIRQRLIEDGKIETVILFGNDVFTTSRTAVAMVVFSNGNQTPRILDTRDTMLTKTRSQEISLRAIGDIESRYQDMWHATRHCQMPTKMELAEHAYSLSFPDYIDPLQSVPAEAKIPLGSLADITRGISVKRINVNKDQANCYVVRVLHISDGHVRVGLRACEDLKKPYPIMPGDVLLAGRGTQIKAALVEKEYDLPVLADNNVLVIRPQSPRLNSTYLTALLNSRLGRELMQTLQVGGDAILSISPGKLRKLVIPVPDRDIQEKMAAEYTAADKEVQAARAQLWEKLHERDQIISNYIEIE
ncbi:N-6 DNA methylase [uncultured Megasphaera sp.]|uniref:N-6 DNA methylase n=1 Tax=uncultured Megasphaera sp. TaxID=165188 RepID=UPI0025985BA9|nr:N-6 DNA methylase [uncultured Megasphaera sp.]